MARVINFELPADDPERAIASFGKVFGWKIDKWGDQDYCADTEGNAFGMMQIFEPAG